MSTNQRRRRSDQDMTPDMERHLQTAIAAVLVATLLWFGNTMMDLRDRITAIEVQVADVRESLKDDANNAYTARDATRDFASIHRRLTTVEHSIEGRKK
jgi:hypothetical protein